MALNGKMVNAGLSPLANEHPAQLRWKVPCLCGNVSTLERTSRKILREVLTPACGSVSTTALWKYFHMAT
jgi:hypothetical protein